MGSSKATTHVIEIESGIGEPSFIPLTLGTELQPLSIGRKGMWKLESARVQDVHAFIYFDGAALFVQSADQAATTTVDGAAVGQTWTELHAPCSIEIGSARLRYRSLLAEAQEAALKPERPFRPGEFVTQSGEESTRVAPIDERRQSREPPQPAAGRPPEPEESDPQLLRTAELPVTYPTSARRSVPPPAAEAAYPQAYVAPSHPPPAVLPVPAYGTPSVRGSTSVLPGGYPVPGSIPPSMPPGYATHTHAGASGAYGSLPPSPMPMNPNATHPGYGSMSGSHAGPTGGGDLIARYKELPPLKRVLVLLAPFCLVAAGYLILFDDPGHAQASRDAGVESAATTFATVPAATTAAPTPTMLVPTTTTAATTQPGAPTATPTSTAPAPTGPQGSTPPPATPAACPSGYVPYTAIPIPPGAPIPCVPAGTPMPAGTTTPPVAPNVVDGGASDASLHVASHDARTLERRAVDYLAAGDYPHATAAYDELLRQHPNSRVYAEASRILRAKMDAGAP